MNVVKLVDSENHTAEPKIMTFLPATGVMTV